MLATFRGEARLDVATPRALPDALMRMTHLILTLHISLQRQFLLQAETFIQARRSNVHYLLTSTDASLPPCMPPVAS